jgi:SAM-dependent methyltransferase
MFERETLGLPPPTTSVLRSKLQGGLAIVRAYAALATGRVAHHRIFGDLPDDVWLSMNTTAYRRYAVLRRVLRSLPDEDIQRRFIGNVGDAALAEAYRAYQIMRAVIARRSLPLQNTAVLDFGCGWGRFVRFFLRDTPAEQLYGVDVMPLAIELSRQTNPWCQFSLVEPLPPSHLPDEHFGVIYLYSVFSHLSEEAHLRWLAEFHRLLRPGGLLFATTRTREFINECERARTGEIPGGHARLPNAFVEPAHWLARYDRGEYCYSAVGGGDGLAGGNVLTADFYGETCIPDAYVRRRWTDRFAILDYLEADGWWLSQNLIIAQRH